MEQHEATAPNTPPATERNVNDAQPTQCTKCGQVLSNEHDGWPLCSRCDYETRQVKRVRDAEKLAKRHKAHDPGIREFFVHDLRVD